MRSIKVAVVDYGVGNFLSILRGFEYCGANITLTSDRGVIKSADRIVLPGVGAFNAAVDALSHYGLDETIREVAHKQIPLMGICLGMQLLLDESYEFGRTKGLGLISGSVVSLPKNSTSGKPLKSPSIGWKGLLPSSESLKWSQTILKNVRCSDSVYFVHSYMACPQNKENRLADYDFGGHNVAAVIQKEKVIGCQFHPEKSGAVGLTILKQFLSDEI